MRSALKYFILGFKNAFGKISFSDFGGYEYGELTRHINEKRKANFENLYGKKQVSQKTK